MHDSLITCIICITHPTVPIYHNRDEWIAWNKRGDPVLHIDLGKWADLLVIAPLSANSLSKIATVSAPFIVKYLR